jgi:hypothetical protein
MDSKLSYQYAKACHNHGTTIYPKPSNTGKYKIIINTRGTEKIGEETYQDQSYIKELIIKTPQGIKRIKTVVPSIHDKIADLYKQICETNKLLEPIIN